MFRNFLKHYIYLCTIFNSLAEVGECALSCLRCGLCCKNLCNKDLNRLRKRIDNIKITKDDINKANCNYSYSNFNFTGKFEKLEGSGRFIKAEDSINLNKFFKEFSEYLGDEYPGHDKFEDSYDLFCSYFTSRMAAKVQYDLAGGKVDNYIVIEGTIKIPNDMTIDDFKKKYFLFEKDGNDFNYMMYNMVRNCMNNNYGFSYYLDNMSEFAEYNFELSKYDKDKNNKDLVPRNKKIENLITKENLPILFDSKIKGKNLIIIYKYYRRGEVSIFTQKEN